MSSPTTTGYYWLQTIYTRRDTMQKMGNIPEVVRVNMEYTARTKVVPYVIATGWRGPLSDIGDDARWDGPLPCPFPYKELSL